MICESVIGSSWKVFLRRCCSSFLTEASYSETSLRRDENAHRTFMGNRDYLHRNCLYAVASLCNG